MNFRGKLKYMEGRKAKPSLRILFTFFLTLMVSPLAACAPPIPSTPTEIIPIPTSESSTTTAMVPVTSLTETPTQAVIPTATQTADPSLSFSADADARVKQSNPDTNYGTGKTLQVDGGKDPTVESFLRFTVTGVTGPIQSARLRLYVADDGSRNGPAVYASDNSWTESDITWNNRPAQTGEAIDNKDAIATYAWVEYDVTPLVTGDGTFNFVLAADSSDGVIFSSREGDHPPQLVITVGADSASTPMTPPMPGRG